ncbi:FhaA domain-containing protein [Streptomyces sp. NPDC002004]
MGFFKRCEDTLEGWETGLARWVRGRDPVELFDALRRHCDEHAVVCSPGRTLVPNAYRIELAAGVHARLGHVDQEVCLELTDVLAQHGARRGYEWAGPLTVCVTEAAGALVRRYRISSEALSHIPAAGLAPM